jgi:4-hydroxy-tetrahydrodipicolinate synthase
MVAPVGTEGQQEGFGTVGRYGRSMMTSAPGPAALHASVPTVLHDDGQLDHDGQTALAAAHAEAGARRLLALDLSAGAVTQLDDDERVAVLAAVRRGAGGVPVGAGVGPPGPAQIRTARRLADSGADLLVVPVGPTSPRREEQLEEVAAAGVPLVLHHHPVATGAALTALALVALVGHVEASAVVLETAPVADPVADLTAADVAVLGGLGGLFLLEELEAGAVGTAAASGVPEHLVAVLDRHSAGDATARRDAHLMAGGYLRLEAGRAGPAVRAEAWRQRGRILSGRVREGAPLGAATKRAITRRLRDLGVELVAPYPGA